MRAPFPSILRKPPRRTPASALRAFLGSEAGGGVLLILAAALALVCANSALHDRYEALLGAPIGPLSVHLWINDALMALFFLLVGLEIKRELVDGHLASWSARRLPVIAAAAGMALPALVYLGVARGDAGLMRGWAVPAATDIAFAIGILTLAGSRVPPSLKLLLTTVAIVDDMGAVAIIALAYTDAIDLVAIACAAAILGVMLLLGRCGVVRLWPFLLLAAGLWIAVFASGVHATVAGVLAALAIPLRRSPGAPDDARSPLHRLEYGLQPWVAYGIMPLFGFANAGVAVGGAATLLTPVALAVAAGLFVGKQAGIFASVRVAVALGLARRPRGATWLQVYGMALLCGIGFTMSLFIGTLAFADVTRVGEVKVGVLGGSLVSAVCGFLVLRFAPPRVTSPPRPANPVA